MRSTVILIEKGFKRSFLPVLAARHRAIVDGEELGFLLVKNRSDRHTPEKSNDRNVTYLECLGQTAVEQPRELLHGHLRRTQKLMFSFGQRIDDGLDLLSYAREFALLSPSAGLSAFPIIRDGGGEVPLTSLKGWIAPFQTMGTIDTEFRRLVAPVLPCEWKPGLLEFSLMAVIAKEPEHLRATMTEMAALPIGDIFFRNLPHEDRARCERTNYSTLRDRFDYFLVRNVFVDTYSHDPVLNDAGLEWLSKVDPEIFAPDIVERLTAWCERDFETNAIEIKSFFEDMRGRQLAFAGKDRPPTTNPTGVRP